MNRDYYEDQLTNLSNERDDLKETVERWKELARELAGALESVVHHAEPDEDRIASALDDYMVALKEDIA